MNQDLLGDALVCPYPGLILTLKAVVGSDVEQVVLYLEAGEKNIMLKNFGPTDKIEWFGAIADEVVEDWADPLNAMLDLRPEFMQMLNERG
jgi:hypothetical protein